MLLLGHLEGLGQDYSNKGKDFWITYPAHIDGNGTSGSVMGIYITSNVNATGQITVGNQVIPFSLTANSVVRKFIGNVTGSDASSTPVYLSQDDGISSNAAIHVISDNNVAVYAHIIKSARSGATLVLPSNVWGKEYIVPSYKCETTSNKSNGAISVVAAEANTQIEITPSVNSKNGLKVAGTAYNITLPNPGDVYQLQFASLADISGTKIRSIATSGTTCKKIAVFSSTTWSAFGCSNASSGDNLYQQLFPVGSWGVNFLTAPFKTRVSDIIRVYVNDLTTIVTKTENSITTTLTGLNPTGGYFEYTTGNPTALKSDKPISVVQFMSTMQCQSGATIGDPEMIVINPIEQTINNITVFSASKNWVPANQSSITNSYLNIIITNSSIGSFKINGIKPQSNFIAIPNTVYSYLQEEITSAVATNPISTLSADSGFIAIAYGLGNVESYGYNAGTSVKDFSQTGAFQNPYKRIDSAISCINMPFQFSIPLNFIPSSIKWDFSTAPNILPNVTVTPSSVVWDSVVTLNNQTAYYFSPQQSYKFSHSNTAAIRDTIKMYTTSTTPDGCGSTEQLYTIPVKVMDLPSANFTTNNSGCITDSVHFFDASLPNGESFIESALWDFGDNTATIAFNPVKKYLTSGIFNIRYRPINNYGCAGDTTIVKSYSDLPISQFSVSDSCLNQTIKITDLSSVANIGSIVKWYWDYGNGFKDTLTTNQFRSVTYADTGVYKISLVVETNTGCVSTAFIKTIHIRPLPEVGFILPEVCQNDAVTQFKDSTKISDNTNNFTYLWNFNAASPAVTPAPVPITVGDFTAKNPKVKYTKPANYTVSEKVTSIYGCVTNFSQSFTVNGSNPNPDFVVLNNSALCSNLQVSIRNKSAMLDFGNVTRIDIYWDTNDLTKKSSIETPYFDSIYSHIYPNFQSPASKNYTIRLDAFSGDANSSCHKSIEKTITVLQSPKVAFSTIPSICLDASPRLIQEASFDNRIPNAAGSPIYTGLGIKNSLTGSFDPSITGVGGPFKINYLTISDKGCRDSISQTITVWPSPEAKWNITAPLCEKNNFLFKDSSIANYSKITQRIWDFGLGVTIDKKTDTVFNYQYATANSYQVSLKVITDSGCISVTNTKTLKINYLPRVQFAIPAIVCLPDGMANFMNSSSIPDGTESLFSYYWNFGDPNNASAWLLKDGKHRYSAIGAYPVNLKITSQDGCIDSLSLQFSNIYPQPKANFSNSADTICINNQIVFADHSNGISSTVNAWHWDFGNGTSDILQNPTKNYSDSGSFTVSLFIYNLQGCVSDTASKIISVQPYPVLKLGPSKVVLENGQISIIPQFVFGRGLQYLWTPSDYLNNDTAAIPISVPKTDITYKLTLTGLGNCAVTDTIFIKVLFAPLVPNAFSPNGDGINDTWKILYLESYPGATIDIFNRYGQKVFSSTGYNSEWDGKFNGSPLPIGTYYYIINPKNGRALINGSVTIIK